jgi:hypothetical protein
MSDEFTQNSRASHRRYAFQPPTRRRHRLDDQEVGKLPTPSDDVIVAPSISQSTIPPPLLRHRMSLLPSALKS